MCDSDENEKDLEETPEPEPKEIEAPDLVSVNEGFTVDNNKEK